MPRSIGNYRSGALIVLKKAAGPILADEMGFVQIMTFAYKIFPRDVVVEDIW
jgi:hypothetical protein